MVAIAARSRRNERATLPKYSSYRFERRRVSRFQPPFRRSGQPRSCPSGAPRAGWAARRLPDASRRGHTWWTSAVPERSQIRFQQGTRADADSLRLQCDENFSHALNPRFYVLGSASPRPAPTRCAESQGEGGKPRGTWVRSGRNVSERRVGAWARGGEEHGRERGGRT